MLFIHCTKYQYNYNDIYVCLAYGVLFMENYVSIGDAKIWTTIHDNLKEEKPYLCLCGGGPGIMDSLSDVDDLLYERFNIIRWEQRGCGRSTADGNYSIYIAIDDLESIRKFYGIKQWFIGGHSWGAGLSLAYALSYQDNCKGIIYISGIGMQNDNDWIEEFNNNCKKLEGPEVPLPSEFSINFDVLNIGQRSFNDYIKRPMLYKEISELRVPVLILYGTNDIRPVWPVVQLSYLLPNCITKMIDGAGHFIWIDKPLELQNAVFLWLDNL